MLEPGSDVILSHHWLQLLAAVPPVGDLAAEELRLAAAALQLPAGRANLPPVQRAAAGGDPGDVRLEKTPKASEIF